MPSMINGVQVGRSLPLATGQTTQYNSELDDGYYEKGLAKAYTIYTTGQYTGTSNVDLIHRTAATIAFVSATKKITDSGNGLALFKTGQTIVVTGSASNNGVKTIATGNVAAEIVTTEALVDEAAGATVSIAKREAISNNCVLDMNTGRMWSRYVAAVMGTAGDGKMPWTGQLYDIFAYCAAANTAALGGYTDWRVPNIFELFSLSNFTTNALPDSTAFPTLTITMSCASSTSRPDDVNYRKGIDWGSGTLDNPALATARYVLLVRG